MFVDGGNHKRHYEQELRVVGRALARLEYVVSEVGDQRPVVVLAAAVDALKGFFVQQAGHAVLGGNFAHGFHRQLVLVGGDVYGRVYGRKFVLCGRDFVVLGFGEHAQFPQFLVEVAHECGDAGFDCAEIVVVEFLTLRRFCAEQCSARVEQVAAFLEGFGVDEEVFLFGAHRGGNLLGLSAEQTEQFDGFAADGFHRTQQRRFLVEGVSVIAAKRRGNAEYAVFYEGIGGGVPRGIAARFEGGAQSAAGERTRVGFAFDEFLAAEFHNHAAVLGGRDEGVVLLGGKSRHGLEPVREMGYALFDSPILHRVCDDVCRFEGQRAVTRAAFLELFVGVFRETFAHHLFVENHTPEQFGHYHRLLLPTRNASI